MNGSTNTDTPAATRPAPARRQRVKKLLHVVRRGHLYLGLFLFPWAVLYGVTAFMFNHPTLLNDQPTRSFGRAEIAGTPLEGMPSAADHAGQVVQLLNETHRPAAPYTLGTGRVRYSRDFAVATVKADGQTVTVLVDVNTGGGIVRRAPTPATDVPKAPFALGPAGQGGPARSPGRPGSAGVRPDPSLPERIKASVPTILERTGYPTGEVTVTSVPDLIFPVTADGRSWTATYNPVSGTVGGVPADTETGIGWRRFMLRLHTAHGYPGEADARWFWAVIVDVMAGVMCFWGLSGLLMWWQIKATRKAGAVVLVLSAVVASALGFAMHAAMS